VTLLQWNGEPTTGAFECDGTITEDAPCNCTGTTQFFTDQIEAEGTDLGGDSDTGYAPDEFTNLPVTGSATGTVSVPPLVCPDSLCNIGTCSTETGCGLTPVDDSTDAGCTDTDLNNCTTPGCVAGECVQNHVTIPCVAEVCNTAACDETGACIQTPVDDSTNDPLCLNTDTDNCTTPGCVAGECVQAHVTTPCDPEVCNTAACDETGACVQTPVDDSTNDPLCTDTDADVCTTPGCQAGECVQAHITDPTCGEIVCRTPGFWGTHGGLEKSSSEDTTCDVLANFGGTLVICGEPITNCDLCSEESALEAICASPKGDSSLQLARQLTAAALNCAITKATDTEGACVPTAVDGANPCGGLGTNIEALFQACNSACPGSLTGGDSIACIGLIDCFNNGFAIEFDEATNTFSCGALTGCEEADSGCFDQTPPKPAGSSFECRDSRKNCVTIFGTIDGCEETICE
jgi:hypothetical protein